MKMNNQSITALRKAPVFLMTEYRITFGVGLTRDQTYIDESVRDRALNRIRSMTVDLYGGCTMSDAIGSYRMADGDVVHEPAKVLTISVPHTVDTSEVVELAARIGDMLRQESVMLSRGDRSTLIFV